MMKVSLLSGAPLDYWVARAAGYSEREVILSNYLGRGDYVCIYAHTMRGPFHCGPRGHGAMSYSPSTDWAQGGPIIDREQIIYRHHAGGVYEACKMAGEIGVNRKRIGAQKGATLLEAVMRAYVTSKYGDEVPDVEGVAP